MKNSEVHELTCIASVRVEKFCSDPKLVNCRISITTEAFGEEGVFYHAQTVQVHGAGLAKLRDILNNLPAE